MNTLTGQLNMTLIEWIAELMEDEYYSDCPIGDIELIGDTIDATGKSLGIQYIEFNTKDKRRFRLTLEEVTDDSPAHR